MPLGEAILKSKTKDIMKCFFAIMCSIFEIWRSFVHHERFGLLDIQLELQEKALCHIMNAIFAGKKSLLTSKDIKFVIMLLNNTKTLNILHSYYFNKCFR